MQCTEANRKGFLKEISGEADLWEVCRLNKYVKVVVKSLLGTHCNTAVSV